MEYPRNGMFLVEQNNIDRYLANDVTFARLDALTKGGDADLVCQKWLIQSAAKRYVFESLYGDLFDTTRSWRVLDVGGGLTSFTRELAIRHNYLLADLLVHDSKELAEAIKNDVGKNFICADDWAKIQRDQYDLIIANDIFPNVDQRLELFLTNFLPQARRLRFSLTYYDTPRYYMTRRIDADEVLCMLAWDGRHLRNALERFSRNIVSANMSVFDQESISVYPNGRKVCLIEFQGDIVTGEYR